MSPRIASLLFAWHAFVLQLALVQAANVEKDSEHPRPLLRSDLSPKAKPAPYGGKRAPEPPSIIDPVIEAHFQQVRAAKAAPKHKPFAHESSDGKRGSGSGARQREGTAAASLQEINAQSSGGGAASLEGSSSTRHQTVNSRVATQEAGRAAVQRHRHELEQLSELEQNPDEGSGTEASLTEQYTCGPNLPCTVVGCFEAAEDDAKDPVQLDDGIRRGRDLTCADYTPAPGPCRSGLPFYRVAMNDLSPGVCFQYCLGKGLDLSGIFKGQECRCGASWRLKSVWNYGHTPVHLSFGGMLHRSKFKPSDQCDITIFNYTGEVKNGAIPRGLTSYSTFDQRYIARIAFPAIELDYLNKRKYMEELYKSDLNFTSRIIKHFSNPSNHPVNLTTSKASSSSLTAIAETTGTSWSQKLSKCGVAQTRGVANLVKNEGWTQSRAERSLKCKVPPELQSEIDGVSLLRKTEHRRDVFASVLEKQSSSKGDLEGNATRRCVDLNEKETCTEMACSCPDTHVKEVLLRANGDECWACAVHCSRGFSDQCGVLPCRCDRNAFEVAVAHSKSTAAGTAEPCIKCLDGENFTVEPWPTPQPHDVNYRQVVIPYLVESEYEDYGLDTQRMDVLRRAFAEVSNTVPCVRFRKINASAKEDDDAYIKGHFLYVLKPPTERNWCLAQNGGNRRRARSTMAKQRRRVRLNATEIDTVYLRSMRMSAWLGPSLLWLGYCNNDRWMPKILMELGHILGLRSPTERPDAAKEWADPWGGKGVKHNPHIKVLWNNFVNDSASEPFVTKEEAYTGSAADGIMDTFSGYAEYDYLSIMHPDIGTGSADPSKPTFETLPYGFLDTVVGTSPTFSQGDANALGDMYQCNTDRAFIAQGYREGQTVTSLHYTDLSNLVLSDLGSEQSWVMAKETKDIDGWIESRQKAGRYQLSVLRYQPKDKAFVAMMDTNRWSRRRTSGMVEQRYHIGTSFDGFRTWVEDGHKQDYFITDMGSDAGYVTGVMTKMPAEDNSVQTMFWSPNWTHAVETIQTRAAMNPPYAVTNLMLHNKWNEIGDGCCGGDRAKNSLFTGDNFVYKSCQIKCEEYYNCGVIEVNASGYCEIWSDEFKCDQLDYGCNGGSTDNVKVYGLSQSWVAALTSNTTISEQLITIAPNEPEAIKFINTHYRNKQEPARITSIMQTPDGGFVVIMSTADVDRGAPYWTSPTDRVQRYALNQPYKGYFAG